MKIRVILAGRRLLRKTKWRTMIYSRINRAYPRLIIKTRKTRVMKRSLLAKIMIVHDILYILNTNII